MVMTSQELAEAVGTECLEFLADAIEGGLAMYNPQNYNPVACLDHTASLRAAIRNAHIVHGASRMLLKRPDLGIRLVNRRNRALFIIKDQVRCSFKLLDKRLRYHNHPTQQSMAFDEQRLPADKAVEQIHNSQDTLWPVDAPEPITNVVAGYSFTDDVEVNFQLKLVCPNGRKGHFWVLSLTSSEIRELVAMPAKTKTAAIHQKIRQSRIRPRSGIMTKQDTPGTA